MANYRKPIFTFGEKRRSQFRLAKRRQRERERAERLKQNPVRAELEAAADAERKAARSLAAVVSGEAFEPDAISRAMTRYRAAFDRRIRADSAADSVKLRTRKLPDGANPLFADLFGRAEP